MAAYKIHPNGPLNSKLIHLLYLFGHHRGMNVNISTSKSYLFRPRVKNTYSVTCYQGSAQVIY